ncbi:MAG TPA: hypothetical protein VD861_16665, partial [Pyrinomonadaceae bacterium]|nr:hypothetical protein [Pyrinomonadaceae bacterium]
VCRRLREPAQEARRRGEREGVVFAPNLIQGDDLPTLAPQGVLWARHLHVFAGTTWEENKERFYQHAYYQGLDAHWLERELKDNNYIVVIALFGWGRHHARLTANSKPLSADEIAAEVDRYNNYTSTFTRDRAAAPQLSYLVTDADSTADFKNLDRWYERDSGEQHGKFVLYRVRLRDVKSER